MTQGDRIILPKYQQGLVSKKSKETFVNENKVKLHRAVLDMKNLTYDYNWKNGSHLIYLTRVFENKFLLGFWSHSSWGTTRNQEQGWMIIDSNTLEIVEEQESRTMGQTSGEAWQWLAELKVKYGKSNFLVDENGDRRWKITEIN